MFAQHAIAAIVSSVMLLLGTDVVFGQSYPSKLVRIVVPFTAGGGADAVGRLVAGKLTAALGQSVIVDNRPGAGGNIGTKMVANAPPDGYTFLIVSSSFSTNPIIYANAGYDPVKEFESVTGLTSYMLFLVCHPSSPLHSVKALIALAKEHGLTIKVVGIEHISEALNESIGSVVTPS